MQNKGAIRLFAILLAIASIYQLFFTYKTYTVKQDAIEFSKGDKTIEREYLDSISGEPVYNFLGIQDYTYSECQDREINLGLDLKGGMNVTLEISVVDLIRELSIDRNDPTLLKAISKAKMYQRNNTSDDFVTLFGKAFAEVAPDAKLSAFFQTPKLKDQIPFGASNDKVISALKEYSNAAIETSFKILNSRINKFGVSQPNIQKLGNTGRVMIELPGVKEPSRVRKLLQQTAKLEFWRTYENSEMYSYLLQANAKIKQLNEIKTSKDTTKTEEITDIETEITNDTLAEAKDTSNDENIDDLLADADSTKIEDKQQQLSEEEIIKNYPLFHILKPNLNREGSPLPGSEVGFTHIKDTAKVNEYLRLKQVKSIFPHDVRFMWGFKPLKNNEEFYFLYAIKTNRDGKAPLSGEVVSRASKQMSPTGELDVSMSMNSEGANIWRKLTGQNVGRCVAITLDNYVRSAPRVQSEISGGSTSISGNFDVKEAEDLANVLMSGALPTPARILQEEIVGPSLGKKAISSGLGSFIIAFLFVLLYMIFYYNRAGYVANIALLINVFFIVGVLASLGAVLTLPGIAGIILTIGMSVDANVLIYERIKEELRSGKGLKLAVSDGYKNAYSSIIDANVTTLLTGIVLFIFGQGPIQGFATTLIIGILTSLFSAIFITRIIFIRMFEKDRKISFSIKLTENAFNNMGIKFLEKRKTFYIISGIILVIGIASLATKGLNYGVDFKGGRTYIVKFNTDVNTADIAKALKLSFTHSPEVKTFGDNNQVKITTKYLIDEQGEDVDNKVEAALYNGLKPILGSDVTKADFLENYRQSSQKVGPTIADDIKVSSVWAILFSLIIIFLYILMRFKNWQYSLGAIVALVHDVLIVLSLFSIFYGILPFSLEIDQAFIAAILTVVGYSINDTVVVFDRLREYLNLYKKRDVIETIDKALNSTVSRTFSTSISTFVVLLAVFIFGGEVIRGFTFAMLIGVIVGTYSSLFIATPISYDVMHKNIEKLETKKK